VRTLGRAPCGALRELCREPLAELRAEPLAELCAEPLVELRAELLAERLAGPLVKLCTELSDGQVTHKNSVD